jgi:hypothetical protein
MMTEARPRSRADVDEDADPLRRADHAHRVGHRRVALQLV